MTERIKTALSTNLGHVITIVLTFGAMLVAYGRLEQRQCDAERRIGKVEESVSPIAGQIGRLEGKIDLLIALNSGNVTTAKKATP